MTGLASHLSQPVSLVNPIEKCFKVFFMTLGKTQKPPQGFLLRIIYFPVTTNNQKQNRQSDIVLFLVYTSKGDSVVENNIDDTSDLDQKLLTVSTNVIFGPKTTPVVRNKIESPFGPVPLGLSGL